MITAKQLSEAYISGANNIENNRQKVDALNVFPVPDGDTGTNMSMTMGAAREDLLHNDYPTVGDVAGKAASALLRGARGNSGVITSLLFRGFSKGLKHKSEAGAADLVEALEIGVAAAYKAVMKPTEGTILTVARVAAERAGRPDRHHGAAGDMGSDHPICRGGAGPDPGAAAGAEKGRCSGCRRAGTGVHPEGDAAGLCRGGRGARYCRRYRCRPR